MASRNTNTDNTNSRLIKNHLPFELDGGIARRAAIGVIVLGSDHTIEHEFRTFLNLDGVATYHSRIPNSPIISPESLADMEHRLPESARIILPGVKLDVIAYGCTSASMVLGEEKVFERIRSARPEVKCTTPITAAIAAFKALGMKKLAVLTPYSKEVNSAVTRYIEQRSLAVTAFGSFNEEDDNRAAKITTDSIQQAAIELGGLPDADGVFVSCTSLRTAPVIARIEEAIGKPVTSSNHAMGWHCLRLAGIRDKRPDLGQLYAV